MFAQDKENQQIDLWDLYIKDDIEKNEPNTIFNCPQYPDINSFHVTPETGEIPNRELLLFYREPFQADEILKICREYGELIEPYQDPCGNPVYVDSTRQFEGIYSVVYFKIGDAEKAHSKIKNNGYALYSVGNLDKPKNEGTIVVFNLNTNPSEKEIRELFQNCGSIRQVRTTPNRPSQRYIEFDDLRDAQKAKERFHNRKYKGAKLIVDFSLPGGFRRVKQDSLYSFSVNLPTKLAPIIIKGCEKKTFVM